MKICDNTKLVGRYAQKRRKRFEWLWKLLNRASYRQVKKHWISK